MKRKLPDEINKCCGLCEYAKRVDISGEILCTKKKNLKKVKEDSVCRYFSFDILSYRPNPTKLPKFDVSEISDIL